MKRLWGVFYIEPRGSRHPWHVSLIGCIFKYACYRLHISYRFIKLYICSWNLKNTFRPALSNRITGESALSSVSHTSTRWLCKIRFLPKIFTFFWQHSTLYDRTSINPKVSRQLAIHYIFYFTFPPSVDVFFAAWKKFQLT